MRGVQWVSQDFSGKHFEGLEGGRGDIDSQRGLFKGFSGGMGRYDYHPGQEFNATTDGARPGGGTTLDGDASNVDERGIEGVTNLDDKLKGESMRA